MSVHAVEVVSSSDVDVQNVKNKVADMKAKYGEKLPKQDAPFDQVETMDGTTYYRGSFRVDLTDGSKVAEKDDLAEQIGKEMEKSASWCRVRWHECDHDGDTRTVEREDPVTGETYTTEVSGCDGWTVEREKGNVPEEVYG